MGTVYHHHTIFDRRRPALLFLHPCATIAAAWFAKEAAGTESRLPALRHGRKRLCG